MIPRGPGTYMLLLTLPEQIELPVGRARRISFEPGLYCYAGSALGPVGLAARLGRYAAGNGRRHWHIDYLLPAARLLGALVIENSRRLECSWAAWVDQQARTCIPGFGSSDCACPGHLFWLGPAGEAMPFIEQARSDLSACWHDRPSFS